MVMVAVSLQVVAVACGDGGSGSSCGDVGSGSSCVDGGSGTWS